MRVAICGTEPRMFGTVFDALRRDGVVVGRFDGVAALLADHGVRHGEIEILYTPGGVVVDDAVLARLPALRALVSPFTGVEGFDRTAASARGVLIANGQIDENVESMAEATVLMLLAAAYQLPAAAAAMADGAWPRPAARGRMVKRMTVGMVGYGRIAQEVAARLIPFGCRLVIHAPRLHAPLPEGAEALPLDRLAEQSDAVIVLAALRPDSRHLIDAAFIARMRPEAILVNTARGGLIDEAALVDAARRGRIGFVALDVFEQEPLPPAAAIRALPNAILTPHTIGHTRETIARLPLHALDAIRALLAGKPPLSLVNPEALPLWRARPETRS